MEPQVNLFLIAVVAFKYIVIILREMPPALLLLETGNLMTLPNVVMVLERAPQTNQTDLMNIMLLIQVIIIFMLSYLLTDMI